MLNDILNNAEILAHCESSEFDQAATKLNALTNTHTNNTLQTCWGFGDKYGAEAMVGVLSFLKGVAGAGLPQSVAIEAAYNAWQTRGLDLSNDKMQEQLAGLKAAAEADPQTVAVAPLIVLLSQMGKWQTPKYNTNATAVEIVWRQHLRQQKINAFGQVVAHVNNEILNAGGTLEQAKACVAAWVTGE